MLACLRSIRNQRPEKIIVAVPVANSKAAHEVERESDDFVYLLMPARVEAAEAFYEYLPAVTDEEVKILLSNPETKHETDFSANIRN